jgi:hypothetical protein
MIFWWSDGFKFFLNAYILVASSTWERRSYWLHSWNHTLNSFPPMGREWILVIASSCICGGINWALKSALKVAYVP